MTRCQVASRTPTQKQNTDPRTHLGNQQPTGRTLILTLRSTPQKSPGTTPALTPGEPGLPSPRNCLRPGGLPSASSKMTTQEVRSELQWPSPCASGMGLTSSTQISSPPLAREELSTYLMRFSRKRRALLKTWKQRGGIRSSKEGGRQKDPEQPPKPKPSSLPLVQPAGPSGGHRSHAQSFAPHNTLTGGQHCQGTVCC